MDPPDAQSPLLIECVSCGGSGGFGATGSEEWTDCETCNGIGRIEIASCPKRLVDSEMVVVLDLADLMKEGLPPIAGGVLDQSAWFVNAAKYHWQEKNRAQIELMK